jgi:hypothetical protein
MKTYHLNCDKLNFIYFRGLLLNENMNKSTKRAVLIHYFFEG